MKVVLLARYFNCCAIVPIRDKFKDEFIDILYTSLDSSLSVIMDDVGIYRLGLKPKFISIDTAKRLDSFFTPNIASYSGNQNYFYRLVYADC